MSRSRDNYVLSGSSLFNDIREETLVGARKMGGRMIAKKYPRPVKIEWPEVKNATWQHKLGSRGGKL